MRSRWAPLFVLMYIVGFSVAAAAQTLDHQRCLDPNPDVTIPRCTAIIRSGQETQKNLAQAYYYRGSAYHLKGEHDRAIQDYDQAIRLNPNFPEAFVMRGAAYAFKAYAGEVQYDRAIQDYDEVIRLDPNYRNAYYARGTAYMLKGQKDRAMEDFDQYNWLGGEQ